MASEEDISEAERRAMTEQTERVRRIVAPMEEVGRAVLNDERKIERLRTLVRVTVEFHDYLLSVPPWPQFPEDPLHNMTYMADKILIHVDWFREMTHIYGILDGTRKTTVDWSLVTALTIKDLFLSVYNRFVVERHFQEKCRLLLDLYKLEIVYAGMFYDSKP